MKFGSLFSGIGVFDLGFELAGMECAWQAELDSHASRVLARHWPNRKRYRHVESINYRTGKAWRRYPKPESVDLICGGFPCQDVSVAGKRRGLAGERSGLWFEFHRILSQCRPRWVVIENVPGLLSSNEGRDFAVILRGLVELGYGVCWRVLDAQYFGLAQRRQRVFIVGHLRGGRAAQVFFESEGSGRDSPPSRQARPAHPPAIVFESRYARNGRGAPDTIVPPLKAESGQSGKGDGAPLVAFSGDRDGGDSGEIMPTLKHGGSEASAHGAYKKPSIAGNMGVRRLMPVECERLQGFPDGWTAGQSDSHRYRQLGNAVAVPCAFWIGARILALETS